jgi:predicted alpha/beta-hydrolase family hydrolase
VAEKRTVTIDVDGETAVGALFLKPRRARACFVFAHGAGAGMDHTFMADVAARLGEVGVATLRFQFPYMERHSRRPDRPSVCHATVRAAVAVARRKLPKVPLIAGGKSFGGRMTSQAQAMQPLAGVSGLVFFGYPWHPSHAPSTKRSEHLEAIRVPMLFLQGTRDALGEPKLVKAQIRKYRTWAILHAVDAADHGFHVLVRSGRTDAEVNGELVDVFAAWCGKRFPSGP